MPLLALEPFLFPETLFDETAPRTSVRGRWWLLHTRPRIEKALARRLVACERSFFLPLYRRRWMNAGRRHSSFLPLFPGYLFLRGEEGARLDALESNMVIHAYPVVDQDRLQEELARVNCLMRSPALLMPEDCLQPGTWVEVIEGPFRGLEGKLIRRGNQLRFLVEIELLRRGVSVEMEGWMIRARGQRRE
jgi:transcription termination/antitermination protein NusG